MNNVMFYLNFGKSSVQCKLSYAHLLITVFFRSYHYNYYYVIICSYL